MLIYVLAVLAAGANAVSSVLQRKANRQLPQRLNLSWRLIGRLLHEPVWFGGVLAITVGFLLQATALGSGQLAVVEPILTLELPLTLVLASQVFGSRLGTREWASIAAMTAGLAGLLYFLSPSPGQATTASWQIWVMGAGANLALVAVLVVLALRSPVSRDGPARRLSSRRAALLGAAAGSMFGLTAALMKGMTATFQQGIAVLLTSWQLYAMIAAGVLGMFLVQSALNAGRLLAAQPGLTLSDPVLSVIWGVLAFGEKVRGGSYLILAAISSAVIGAAVLALARSPLLDHGQPGEQTAPVEPPPRPARA